MTEFLSVTLAYPTVVFTGLLALSFLYWILVIIGALGIDLLDFDVGGEHAAEGAAEGAVHGAVEGGVKGAAHAAEAGIVGSALVTLQLRNAPMTLVLSVWLLMAWLGTYFSAAFLLPQPSFLVGTGLALASVIVALPITSMIVRPFSRALKVERQTLRADLVGKMVLVDTSRVDARFGSARAEDGGSGLIIQIRCDSENELARGSQALVLSYDEGREAYEVTPVDDILPRNDDAKVPSAK